MIGLGKRNIHVQYESPITSGLNVTCMAMVKVFQKKFKREGQGHKVKKKIGNHVKGLVTRNTHMQYESPITSGLKVMAKVKVFQK